MNSAKNKAKRAGNPKAPAAAAKKENTSGKTQPAASSGMLTWQVLLSLVFVFIAYLPVFNAGFVNWDDDDYVVKNTLIRNFSDFGSLITTPVQGNYHPLTMISLAMNYAASGLHPFSYHLVNLILHLLNVFLVYRLVMLLSGSTVISFFTAMLFGIHPLHVESVAWTSERKDVLYTFFFLLGLISYAHYCMRRQVKQLVMSFLWFALSILSKPAAIIFPAVMFVVDFFLKRKSNGKLILEKIPFLLVSALFAYLTLHGQQTVGATDATAMFSLSTRMLFGCYGYTMYFLKTMVPVNLVAFYPTPPVNEPLAAYFFLAPLFLIATLAICFVTWKKDRTIAFGVLFYLVNLALVLQLVVVGSALMADRYTYVPLIGIFFIGGYLLDKWDPLESTCRHASLSIL